MVLDRRNFLRTGIAGFGSIMLLPSCISRGGPFAFFTPEEAKCLIAVCEQIIPEDEFGGGATKAGVIHYIDRQLLAVFSYDQMKYQHGISAIQASSLEIYGLRFEQITLDKQYGILKMMEQGKLPVQHWDVIDQSSFFRLIIQHTMQGFYGPPRHGGNNNYMSYQMMGLDFPLVIGRNHYRKLT